MLTLVKWAGVAIVQEGGEKNWKKHKWQNEAEANMFPQSLKLGYLVPNKVKQHHLTTYVLSII